MHTSFQYPVNQIFHAKPSYPAVYNDLIDGGSHHGRERIEGAKDFRGKRSFQTKLQTF
ncbi:MAG: hypothetical protein ACRD28_13940 [Acidobacteriaceae bacterium]